MSEENLECVYDKLLVEEVASIDDVTDEELATQVVEGMIADKEAALKKLENSKVREGVTVAEKIAAAQQRKAAIEQAKAELAKWQEIAAVKTQRAETAVAQPAVESAPVEEQTASVVEQTVVEETPQTTNEIQPEQKESGSSEIPNNQSVAEGDVPGQSGVRNVRDWLTPENLDWAEDKTLKEIIEKFGNTLEPIARIPEKVMVLLGIKDGYIYSGKGYFIDHAVNHHPEVTLDEYDNIQSIISDSDDIKDLSTDKIKKVAFIKKLDKGYAVVVEISEENGKVLLHKTFFYKDSNSNRIPYKNKPSLLKESPADGSTTISPEDNNQQPADTENISALDASSASEDRNSVSNSQENAEKSDENAENGGEKMYSPEELAEAKEQLGELNATSAPEFAARLFSIKPWKTLEEANAALKELLASYGETLNGQSLAVMPFLDKAQGLIREYNKSQEPRSVEEVLENGDKRITNYNSRGEVATVATERDGKVVSVDSYDEGVLFEHTEYDTNGVSTSVTRYDKQGNPVVSGKTEQPETNDVTNAGPVNMETLQLNMSDEDFNALLNGGDKTAISEYLAEMDGLLRIGAGSPLDGRDAIVKEYRGLVEQYGGEENIPADVAAGINERIAPYNALQRAVFDRKYALQDKLREIEASEAQAKELAEKEAKAEHKQTAFGGFLAGKTDLGASAAEKALNKKYDFDGKVMTVAEFVEEAVGNGDAKLSTMEEPKYKGASRAAWNRMDARQQEADAKRVKESGTKTVYTVNDHDLGKTAYDYAKFLLDKKAEQEKVAAKQMVKNLIQPFAKEKSEEIDEGIMFRTTYHGSGAKFDKFDHSFMGTGEGAQAYGWGTYVTEVEGIGRTYATTMRDKLISEKHKENATINKLAKQTLESSNGNKEEALDYLRGLLNESWSDKKRVKAQIKIIETGKFLPETKQKANLYTVDIPDDNGSNYLHWDKPINGEIQERVANGLQNIGFEIEPGMNHLAYSRDGKIAVLNINAKGKDLYAELSEVLGGDKEASQFLNRQGFVGISYPANATTGGRADGARNYVIFNEDDAVIEEHVMFRMSKTPQEFDLMQKAAVEKRGIVSPGLNNTAVNVVDVPRHDFVGSLKEARTKAKEWAVENYTGKEFDLPDNAGKYVISKNAIGKYLDKSAFDKSENATVHLSVLKELPNVISNSIEVEIHADYLKGENGERNAENGVNRNDLLVHRIYGAVNIDGNTYRVKTTIHEFRDANTANTPHSYEVTKIELIEDSTVTPNDGIDNPLNRSVNSISATKLLEGVEKSYDKGKKVLDESENLTREGSGPLTDREVVMESDVYSKVLGKPRYYGKRQREFVARQRRRMAEKARLVAEKLNLNNVEVLESTEGLTGKKATSKGWFDPRTGKITVVVPNHGNTGDIVETVLHEAVAHYGLRKLFGENFKNFLDNVYNNVTPEIREEITELAKKHGWDFHTATEEYLASLAENTNFEKVNPSLWSNIKSFFMKMLAKVGITLDEPLGDNELRYILWRSHQNLVAPDMYNNVFAIAENIAKQYELGVGDYAPTVQGNVEAAESETRFRTTGETIENQKVAEGASEEIRFRKMNYDEAVQEAKNFEETHKGSAPIVVLDGIENWENEFIKAGVKQDEIERFRERLKTSSGNPKAAYLDDADLIFIFKPKVDEKDFNGYIWHENIHKAIREDDREGIPTLESALRKIFRDDFDATIKEAEEHGYIGEEAYEELACQLVQVAYLEDKMNANGLKGRGVFQDFINPLIKKIYGRGRGIVHEGVFEESNRANEKEFQGGSLATTADRGTGRDSETETQSTGGLTEE